jgi:hypothetical protein
MAKVQAQEAQKLNRIAEKAWADAAFKQRLLADAAAVLREQGLEVPAGVQVRVIEPSDEARYLVLPAKPVGDLSDEQFAQLAREGPGRKVGQVLLKAWRDGAFKRRLVADPQTVLREEGLPLSDGKPVRVVENTQETVHLVLPPKSPAGELSDAQLSQVAGGIVPVVLGIGLGAAIGFLGGVVATDEGWY